MPPPPKGPETSGPEQPHEISDSIQKRLDEALRTHDSATKDQSLENDSDLKRGALGQHFESQDPEELKIKKLRLKTEQDQQKKTNLQIGEQITRLRTEEKEKQMFSEILQQFELEKATREAEEKEQFETDKKRIQEEKRAQIHRQELNKALEALEGII